MTKPSTPSEATPGSSTRLPQVRIRTSRLFNVISAGLAFVMWGGWAYYVNSGTSSEAERASPLVSGLTQGTGSFLITLVMVRVVSWLYHLLPESRARLLLPGVITVCVTGTCLASAHMVVGTASILETIAPALTVALLFNLFTTYKLRCAERSDQEDWA